MPRLKQLDLLDISKQEKLEAGFQLSSDEESEEEDFQDAVESQGGNGHGKSGKNVWPKKSIPSFENSVDPD